MAVDFAGELGKRIRYLRKKAGLTQEELAADIDMNTTHMGKVERGETNLNLDNLVKIAHRFDMTPATLLKVKPNLTEAELRKEILAMVGRANEKELLLIHAMLDSLIN